MLLFTPGLKTYDSRLTTNSSLSYECRKIGLRYFCEPQLAHHSHQLAAMIRGVVEYMMQHLVYRHLVRYLLTVVELESMLKRTVVILLPYKLNQC